jgi:hypothetical protein
MNDDNLITAWSKVTDPKEALKLILENEDYFGYDPYFRDLRAALLEMAERCSK